MYYEQEPCIMCNAVAVGGCLRLEADEYSLEPGQACMAGIVEFRGSIVFDSRESKYGQTFPITCSAVLFRRTNQYE